MKDSLSPLDELGVTSGWGSGLIEARVTSAGMMMTDGYDDNHRKE